MPRTLTTSVSEILSFSPCAAGLERLRKMTDSKGYGPEEQFPIADVFETCTFSDICWLLGRRESEIKIAAKAARMCADSVRHLKNKYTADAAKAAAKAAAAAAADAAAYAAYAAYAAKTAADADADADADAEDAQHKLNLSFLLNCLKDYESSLA